MKQTSHIPGLIAFILLSAPICSGAQSSVLSSGTWAKFSIDKHGVYKLDRNSLSQAGLEISGVDPKQIRVFSNPGGMLPQPNSSARPQDLVELAVWIKGEEDGVFNSDDYVLFYAEGPDKIGFDPERRIYAYESNLYDDKNYVFVGITPGTNGKRVPSDTNIEGQYPPVDTFEDYQYHETDTHNELKSGREWFGERFDATLTHSFQVSLDGLSTSEPVRLVSDVMAQSHGGSTFTLSLDNASVLQQYVLPISTATYAVKGRHRRDTVLINPGSLSGKQSVELRYQYQKASSGRSVGYLNFFLLSYRRTLALYGEQTEFTSLESTEQPVSAFIVKAPAQAVVWNISNSSNPRIQLTHAANGEHRFSQQSTSLLRYIVFDPIKVKVPGFVSRLENQNLHGKQTPELLIVSHPDFLSEAQRLANHREMHNGLSSLVVSIEQVYNEFSGGRQDVSAIRDLAKYYYDRSPGTLRCLVLFGRGSYDFKDRVYDNTNYVITYESRNSLHPLETYSSDDYFGFLEASEGTWGEESPEYHTLDIGVGRLPVKSLDEARVVVDKLVAYDKSQTRWGSWRNLISFVADDGDANEHQKQANFLAEYVEENHPSYNTNKIFIDAFPQPVRPSGESVPDANRKIIEAINSGSLVINYTGHGAEKLWAQERIFDDFVIVTLKNQQYPLFVTATCEFGRQDDPRQISSAELCLMQPSGGAIGMVSTARPVSSNTNFELNKAFYESLFQTNNGNPLLLGEVFALTKNTSISGVSNRNFSLIGDPSMTLAFPEFNIHVTNISSPAKQDTLSALARIRLTGEIQDNQGTLVNDFNGVVSVLVQDKRSQFVTLGNENAPYSFSKWTGPLFRGKASVSEGVFEIEFVVPKNISYALGYGKLSLYAYDSETNRDASGASTEFVVGENSAQPDTDHESPTISLFMDDETFISGGITGNEPTLLARFEDENGINISTYGVGNGLVAILDDETVFSLSDYYIADTDDFTVGRVNYPLGRLEPGLHTLTVKAWDTFNNPAQATITFRVSEGSGLLIEDFVNYPNPFRESTTLAFTHNRSGDDLEVMLSIHDLSGKLVQSTQQSVTNSPYRVELGVIGENTDFGEILNGGLYLARLTVRSLTDGSKSERVTKLIRLN